MALTTECLGFAKVFITYTGPTFRFIADLSDLDHCWGVLAPGQSGHPASPAYGNSVRPWLTGDYHPMLFRRDEVEQSLVARLRLALV